MNYSRLLIVSTIFLIAQAYGEGAYSTQVYQSGTSGGPSTLPGVGMIAANLPFYASCLAVIVGLSVIVYMTLKRRKANKQQPEA